MTNDEKKQTLAAIGGGSLAIGSNFLGRKVNGNLLQNLSYIDNLTETDLIRKITPKDIGVVRGGSKFQKTIGPHAMDENQLDHYLGKDLSKRFKNEGKKAVVEIKPNWSKFGSLESTAHELGHAEHMVGRGSKLGRIAHKLNRNIPIGGKTAGILSGITAGAALSDDKPKTAAGIGALTGIAATMPEILSERAANKEGLNFLKKGGVKQELINRVGKNYRKQLGGRILQKTIPAASVGLAAGYITNKIKNRKNNS